MVMHNFAKPPPPPLQRLYEIEKDGLNRIFEKIDFFYTPPTHPSPHL